MSTPPLFPLFHPIEDTPGSTHSPSTLLLMKVHNRTLRYARFPMQALSLIEDGSGGLSARHRAVVEHAIIAEHPWVAAIYDECKETGDVRGLMVGRGRGGESDGITGVGVAPSTRSERFRRDCCFTTNGCYGDLGLLMKLSSCFVQKLISLSYVSLTDTVLSLIHI